MRTPINLPTRWRLLRPLLFFIIIISLALSYFFLKSRPNTTVYKRLFLQEIEQSRKSTRNTQDTKYVLFRQLQGAGFNNQVRTFGPLMKRTTLRSPGPRNSTFSPSGPGNVAHVLVSTSYLASTRGQCVDPPLSILVWRNPEQRQCCRFPGGLPCGTYEACPDSFGPCLLGKCEADSCWRGEVYRC